MNVWAGLTSIHVAFVRQHNVMAKKLYDSLSAGNPAMSETELDEKAYQETRKIMAAILQVFSTRYILLFSQSVKFCYA